MDWKKFEQVERGVFKIPGRWLFLHYYDAFNTLFRIENALRVFVYVVLKKELSNEWMNLTVYEEDGGKQSTILSISKQRMAQARSFGYLGYEITCPLMHLTSGELTRIITSEKLWKHFSGHFLGSKEIIKNKLDEIGSVHNSLAHFRPIRADDVDAVKQNARHVLPAIEKCLSSALLQRDTIPTNTQDDWYNSLKTLGTDLCQLRFLQSQDESWVRIQITYRPPVLGRTVPYRNSVNFLLLKLRSSNVPKLYPDLTQRVIYFLESTPYLSMTTERDPQFTKSISLVFNREKLSSDFEKVKLDLESILSEISNQTELISKDHLARGSLLETAVVSAAGRESDGKILWSVNSLVLRDAVTSEDPPEYWGSFSFFQGIDFIAGTDEYPWMPEAISEFEV